MTDNSLRAAAEALARWPEVQARLRAEHRPGPNGRCLGCASQLQTAPRWPCGLAAIAGGQKTRGR